MPQAQREHCTLYATYGSHIFRLSYDRDEQGSLHTRHSGYFARLLVLPGSRVCAKNTSEISHGIHIMCGVHSKHRGSYKTHVRFANECRQTMSVLCDRNIPPKLPTFPGHPKWQCGRSILNAKKEKRNTNSFFVFLTSLLKTINEKGIRQVATPYQVPQITFPHYRQCLYSVPSPNAFGRVRQVTMETAS